MKNLILAVLFLLATDTYAQKYLVQGIAFDSTKGRNEVTVILNDTIRKYLRSDTLNPKTYIKLWKDSSYVTRSKRNGYFRIKARKSDSLRFESYRHIPQTFLVWDLLKTKHIRILLSPQVCETYVACYDTIPERLVFIGKKISVDRLKEKYYCNTMPIIIDEKFAATYAIAERITGNLPPDTIRFLANDHYGKPGFTKYEYAMIFAGRYCGNIIQHKYQFYDVYKTSNGQWAAPYQTFDYSRLDYKSTVKPEIILFEKPVEIDITGLPEEYIVSHYPTPYYQIQNNKAIAVYGNYIKDLLRLKEEVYFKKLIYSSKPLRLKLPSSK